MNHEPLHESSSDKLQYSMCIATGIFAILAIVFANHACNDLRDDVEALGNENLALRQELQRATKPVPRASVAVVP